MWQKLSIFRLLCGKSLNEFQLAWLTTDRLHKGVNISASCSCVIEKTKTLWWSLQTPCEMFWFPLSVCLCVLFKYIIIFILGFQDILEKEDIKLDWMFKVSLMSDLTNVSSRWSDLIIHLVLSRSTEPSHFTMNKTLIMIVKFTLMYHRLARTKIVRGNEQSNSRRKI